MDPINGMWTVYRITDSLLVLRAKKLGGGEGGGGRRLRFFFFYTEEALM